MSFLKVIDGPPVCFLTNIPVTPKQKACSTDRPTEESLHMWMVNFRRLLKNEAFVEKYAVNEFHSREALHSVAGLYDLSLPNMDLETTYTSLTTESAITVLLYRTREAALEEIQKQSKNPDNGAGDQETVDERITAIDELLASDRFTLPQDKVEADPANSDDEKEDVYHPIDTENSDFYEIYSDQASDSESSDEDEENADDQTGENDNNDDEDATEITGTLDTNLEDIGTAEEGGVDDDEEEKDFTLGYNAYFRNSLLRRRKRLASPHALQTSDIGPENLLTAAMTFELKHQDHHRVLHLTFIAVRKTYQRLGLGRQLIELLKEIGRSSDSKAVVVHADNTAVQFFKHQDFTDDYVLNRQWSDFAEEYTNCILMTYLPQFSRDCPGIYESGDNEYGLEIMRMERQIEVWRKTSEQAHTKQLEAFLRMKNEVVHLKAKITSQDEMLRYLMSELRRVTDEKSRLEMKIALLQREQIDSLSRPSSALKSVENGTAPETLTISTLKWILRAGRRTLDSIAIAQITADVQRDLDNVSLEMFKVVYIRPAELPEVVINTFEHTMNAAKELGGVDVRRLYYCAQEKENWKVMDKIISTGFNSSHLHDNDLRFTSNLNALGLGRALVADVILLHAQRIPTNCQDFTVRSPIHALPLALVEFSPVSQQ